MKYKNSWCLLTIVIFITLNTNGWCQNNNSFIKDSLDAYVNKAMELWDIPGVAITIIKNDSILYSKGFGVIKKNTQTKVNSSTLFPIWSMGKSFTAFSLALLEDRNQLKLEDKVKNHFRAFKMKNKDYENEMNCIDLLAHRMGIETFQGDFLWSESTLSNEQLLSKWSNFNPKYPIRSGFQYSNFGYLIAAEVIENRGKKKWQSFISDEILKKLQMDQSILFVDDLKKNRNIAIGHTKINNIINPLQQGEGIKIEAFGGMYANVEEMIQWIRLHLNKGIINNKRIFNEQLFDRVHKPYNTIGKMFLPDGTSPNVNYGLGWEIRDYNNREIITHGGSYTGFVSMMGFVPSDKLGFVILTNSDAHELCEALKWQIINAYSNKPFFNYMTEMFNYTKAGDEQLKIELKKINDSINLKLPTSIPLKNFEGTYYNEIYGKILVKVDLLNNLLLQFEHHPNLTATLKHISDNRFFCEYSQAMFGNVEIPFIIKNKKVEGFELSVHTYVEFTRYSFTKLK